ncbi:MAG: hypothetical protein GYA61_01805, partial [Spirochaetales bacterium]|nr:hypothetical protein [Spirochaetales bacterium]
MKININQVVNSKIVEPKEISKTEKSSETSKVSLNSNQESISPIFIKNNTYKSTFSIQEFISQMQMKISSISLFEKDGDINTINNASYNNIPLFNKEEKEAIFKNKNDLSGIIKGYEEKIDQLRSNLNQILEENSNSVITISEKELKNITKSVYNQLPNSIKTNSTSIIPA